MKGVGLDMKGSGGFKRTCNGMRMRNHGLRTNTTFDFILSLQTLSFKDNTNGPIWHPKPSPGGFKQTRNGMRMRNQTRHRHNISLLSLQTPSFKDNPNGPIWHPKLSPHAKANPIAIQTWSSPPIGLVMIRQ